VPGSGLGLSIVSRICELHGGSVRLENLEAGGLRCEVLLPTYAEPAAKAPPAEAAAKQSAPVREPVG